MPNETKNIVDQHPLEADRMAATELAAEFGEDHPYVVELRAEIALMEAVQQEAERHIQRSRELDGAQRVRSMEQRESEQLRPVLNALAEASFTGGGPYAILRFGVPQTEPETVTKTVGIKNRPYKIVNLIPYEGNDHGAGDPSKAVETALNGTIEQIDQITEGGVSAHGDIADYGTAPLTVGEEDYTVRRLKLDLSGAERAPVYVIYARDQARGEGADAERLLVIAGRMNGDEHDELAQAMAGT